MMPSIDRVHTLQPELDDELIQPFSKFMSKIWMKGSRSVTLYAFWWKNHANNFMLRKHNSEMVVIKHEYGSNRRVLEILRW